jgi:hypothetical protein
MNKKVYTLDERTFAESYFNEMPSFFEGLLPILDLGGTLLDDNYVFRSGYEEDIAALRCDWIVIGQDIRDAIIAFPDHEEAEYLTHERRRKD